MTSEQLPVYLKRHWIKIYQVIPDEINDPLPVGPKEISKPDVGMNFWNTPKNLYMELYKFILSFSN